MLFRASFFVLARGGFVLGASNFSRSFLGAQSKNPQNEKKQIC
jgi:hypothetical protein